MDTAERAAWFANRVRQMDADQPGYATRWGQLTGALLAVGGQLVCPPMEPEPDLDRLLSGGGRRAPAAIATARGRISRCHDNAAALWRRGVGAVWTGYALSGDGLWRQHSWVEIPDGTLVETTEVRTAYYGVEVAAHQRAAGQEPLGDGWDAVYSPDGASLMPPEPAD